MGRTVGQAVRLGGLVVVLLGVGIQPAVAAPGGDAIVEASAFEVPDGATRATDAVVMCPAGTRATGGGVAPVSPVSIDSYRVQLSGPVDATGASVTTDTGDVPRGWAATVSLFSGPPTPEFDDFKVFALCSHDSDALIQAAASSGSGPLFTGAPPCPIGTRAIGGGAGPLVAVPDGSQDYITYSSHPVDETLTTASTVNGDLAKAWATAVGVQNVGTGPRFFSICSAASDAVVRSSSLTVASSPSDISAGTVTCPNGTRALAGGQGTDTALNTASDRLEYTAPLDGSGSLAATGDGDIAKAWRVAVRNTSGADRTFRIFAICGTTAHRPDAHIKRSDQAAFEGLDEYSPTSQVRQWSAKRGQTRAFNLRFENDGDTDSFKVRGCATRSTMTATYINPTTGNDITKSVTGDGYVLSNVAHAARRSLVVRLKPTSSATIGATLNCKVTVTSDADTDITDAVTARLQVVAG